MQENEFEKKVREVMNDFKIDPSAPVWDYVEKRIPKSNRRRRFVAFFFLLAGFTVCGYFFYNKFSADKNEFVKANEIAQEKNIADKKNDQSDVAKNNESTQADTSTIIHEPVARSKETLVLKDDWKQKTGSPKEKNVNIIYKEDEAGNEMGISLAKPNNEINNSINKDQSNTEGAISQNNVVITDEPSINKNTNDSNALITKQNDAITSAALKTNDTAKHKQTKKLSANSKKLEWGFSLLYGKSDVIQTLINLNQDKSLAEAVYSPGNIPIDSIQAAQASKNIKAKSAYAIGFAVRKQFSARSSISIGLEFLHMSTSIQTGYARDSSAVFDYNNSSQLNTVRSFYRPGTGVTVVNKYNLLQLPILYSYQFNKGKKVPLTIDAGLSFARIISSNAVVYDNYNQVYYKNSDLLQKNQVQLLGGINAAIIFQNQSRLYLGPHLQYGLTDVIKNTSNKQHFFTWGIGAKYFLKR